MSARNYSNRSAANKAPQRSIQHSAPDTESPALSPQDSELSTQHSLDLRGVKCPLNWARAKVRLEQLAPGTELELVLDDAKGVRDIPRAAEAAGYVIATVEQRPTDWRIVILT